MLQINDLHYAAIHSKVRHFADNTNFFFANKSFNIKNKYINHDLVLINKWLRANEIGPNTTKTDIIIFRPKNKRIKKHLNFRNSGQKVKPCAKVKYLRVILQEHLEWNTHTNNVKTKYLTIYQNFY